MSSFGARRQLDLSGLGGMTRRQVMQLAAVAGGSLLLAGCTTKPTGVAPSNGSSSSDQIIWSNWPLSVDTEDDGTIPSLVEFEERTGIRVEYLAEINSNDEWFAKVQPLMQGGQGIPASVISPTDWMGGRFISLDWAQKLDKSKLANAKNLLPAFQSPAFDPTRDYSLAWQGWLVGIAVNTDVTGKDVRTVQELLTDPALKGKVSLLTELRETTGTLMLANGADPGAFNDDDFQQAIEDIESARQSGQLRRFTGNDYAADLSQGNIGACLAWAGDVVQLAKDNPAIKFFIPDSGGVLMEDVLMVPTGAPDTEAAHKLIDFYYEPEVAAQVAAYVNAVCPVAGAQDAMASIDPELADNPLIFPDAEEMKKMFTYKPMDLDENQARQSAFDKALGL
ncbi:ABC transporter substrate-binding protein [Ruicaihuangia caeni]|uniref:Spermidine/putrescine ABC transporter substrate-binding protein n=1 Tax=Ruicaihuangia caeni TaxID=3042517 RepID=A0AAW6T923_9MICO|nr:spermidine/putrescine ABC transporter substrate-binding protein [Klugiella sp. YN-L-19]MDI2099281.1 spermidine/putrescine ABC transporter substrate-binding protein [Klugiella sp. YN-L-19]